MKPLQIVACCALLVSLAPVVRAAAPPPPPEELEFLTKGQAAYQRGDFATAKENFEMVYQMDPRNTVAIGYLKRIKADEATKPKYIDIEKQLATIIVPQIQFREATLGSALDYMKKSADRQTGGRVRVNFVPQLPPEVLNTKTVTLNLSNVPFNEAVKYLATVASLDVVYDKYAIILRAKADAAPTTAAATGAPATPGVSPATSALPGAQ